MVHGVGRHDPLSSLLHVYQSFRANLLSPEAPVLFEDRIPDWRLEEVSEDTAPPYLKLVPRFPVGEDDASEVYLYEVNYSALAGLVRRNHRLDLTTLFVGFDMAVCFARQSLKDPRPTIDVGDPARLAKCLQRVAGVFVAATVPVLGLPSILLRNYTETAVGIYTRFFEDVATFALDKNGQQLISAHLDRTVENIVRSSRFTGGDQPLRSQLVIAAHSLGSVVVHNHLVRKWTDPLQHDCVPSRLLTFGSPIGLIMWLWLLLDFKRMEFDANEPTGTNYFCWSAASNAGKPAKPLTWINVINNLDPIASVIPTAAADLTRPTDEVSASLAGGEVIHRFLGSSKPTNAGVAHTAYLHDRRGFIEILLRMAGLFQKDPLEVESVPAQTHWHSSYVTLRWLRVVLWVLAVASAAIYCAVVAYRFDEWRTMGAVLLFVSPRVTIWGLAFWQRLFFGGPTKRIPDERIAAFAWDFSSLPYRIRRVIGPLFGARREVDPEAPRRPLASGVLKFLSFTPTLIAMMVPIALAALLTNQPPGSGVSFIWSAGGLLVFMIYLTLCAASELVATWRQVLEELSLGGSRD